MSIKNTESIIENASNPVFLKLRSDALKIIENALDSVDPKKAILNTVKIVKNELIADDFKIDLDETDRILIIGGGKACGSMAEAVEQLLGERITDGTINLLRGTQNKYWLNKIKINQADHPVPDDDGVEGVQNMLNLVSNASEKDLVITLISGGGSALMPMPADIISLNDLQETTKLLLLAGASINELNAVRKHLSGFKGGQLARRCYPAKVLSLILSDVVGDSLDTIASGPTAPDSTTFHNAISVLQKYGVWNETSITVKERLTSGLKGYIKETPKENDPIFKNVYNVLVANNLKAAKRAAEYAFSLGYNSEVVSTFIEGEARHVGTFFACLAKGIIKQSTPVKNPGALIFGGETTVTVKGSGVGGRNQELALSSIEQIDGLNCIILTFGTDGIDGSSKAAGALVDGSTNRRAQEMGLSIKNYLENNNSYTFFKGLGDCILTGPTGTNVNDLTIILTR